MSGAVSWESYEKTPDVKHLVIPLLSHAETWQAQQQETLPLCHFVAKSPAFAACHVSAWPRRDLASCSTAGGHLRCYKLLHVALYNTAINLSFKKIQKQQEKHQGLHSSWHSIADCRRLHLVPLLLHTHRTLAAGECQLLC